MFRIRHYSFAVYCLPLLLMTVAACQQAPVAVEEEQATAPIPVTTSSQEARELFLEGQEVNDRLRGTDAHDYFAQAVELDPDFARAHLLAGFTSATGQEFFDHLEMAVAASAEVSEGERLLILAAEAGAKGNANGQMSYLNRLVEAHPDDARSHNALGALYFGRQEYESAIEHYQHAIELDPDFSPPYNQKGYAHRFLGDYGAAEASFQKYVELIPDDPNPYDSYAELLMKMGRFEESTAKYREALDQDPNFIASYVGIANNQMFASDMEGARRTLEELSGVARNVGEERTSFIWTAHSFLHEGNYESAIASVANAMLLAGDDAATSAGDLNFLGDIYLAAGDPTAAAESYAKSIEDIERASVADEVKENTRRNILFDQAQVALAQDDLETARATAAAYGEQVAAHGIPFELRQHHELAGMIALSDGDSSGAAAHLVQANQQNPKVLFLLAKAHAAQGNAEEARSFCEQAANFNGLSGTYSFVRTAAREMIEQL